MEEEEGRWRGGLKYDSTTRHRKGVGKVGMKEGEKNQTSLHHAPLRHAADTQSLYESAGRHLRSKKKREGGSGESVTS
jgi:hypothetical protein